MRSVNRRRFLLGAVATVGMVPIGLVSACGTPPPPAPKVGEAPQAAPAAATAKPAAAQPTTAPAAAPKPTRGKELVVAVSTFGEDILDPVGMTSSPMRGFLEPMYDSFIRVDNDGTLIPGVFTSWNVSDDRTYWTCEVRTGIKFHGSWGEATAEDVKFSIERFMGEGSSYMGPARSLIKEVAIQDPYTVRIHTPKPDPTLPLILSQYSVSPHLFLMSKKQIEQQGVDGFRQSPAASGPYQFKNHVPGSSIEYSAFDDHWGIKPGYDSLKVMLVPEVTARVGLLRQGAAHVVEVTPDAAQDVRAAGLDVRGVPGSIQPVIQLYGTYQEVWTGKPTADLRVRKAMSLLINRDEAIQALLPEGELPAAVGISPSNQDIDYARWASVGKTTYKYDIDEAKRLLTEAGYPNGFEISLFAYELSGAPLQSVSQAVAGYWEKAGIKVRLIPTDFGAFRALRDAEPPAPNLLGQAGVHRYPDTPDTLLNQRVMYYGNKGVFRLLNQTPQVSALPDLENALDAVASEFDPGRRKELFANIVTQGMETYVAFPIAQIPILFGIDSKVDLDVRPLSQIGTRVIYAKPKS